jgi:preprotein translocase subunit SecG
MTYNEKYGLSMMLAVIFTLVLLQHEDGVLTAVAIVLFLVSCAVFMYSDNKKEHTND